MNKQLHIYNLGLKDYKETWDYQEALFKTIIALKMQNRAADTHSITPNYLLFVEHPSVYTLGKSGDISHLLLNEQQLTEKGVSFYRINRGGDITYHGPGQLVGYPILDMENFFTDIHRYLRLLEEVVILTLRDYGLKGERSAGETGVWLDPETRFARKICAMGVRSSRWVTMHGFALNVNTHLGYFDYIVPCGIRGKGVTSLQAELDGREVSLPEVTDALLGHFLSVFEATCQKE